MELPFSSLQTPCYVVDEALLERNLVILKQVIDRTGCKILLAQKAFSMFACYPLIGSYLNGTTASGLFEARLGKEEMGGETHIFSPAYREDEIDEILSLCDHVVFNSFSQWEKYRDKVLASGKSAGLRLNPEHSTQDHAIYDPCSPGSRLGITLKKFRPDLLDGIEGLHFHTLCEQDAAPLVETVAVVEEKFGPWLSQMKWLNFGGGHHITRPGYDIDALVSCVSRVQERYGVQVYLEPGEAVALNAGFLVSTVLDVLVVGVSQAIATVPGISRSGMTITTGCFVGFERRFAVRFSFLLSIPAVLGANILSLKDALTGGVDWSQLPVYLAGVVVAAVSGYLCIRLLKMIADKGRFGAFAYYCWAAGLATLILNAVK